MICLGTGGSVEREYLKKDDHAIAKDNKKGNVKGDSDTA